TDRVGRTSYQQIASPIMCSAVFWGKEVKRPPFDTTYNHRSTVHLSSFGSPHIKFAQSTG
ncbi:hypothetical protein VITU9109_04562, partial [Vibrio tubiashii ATCC 19109]